MWLFILAFFGSLFGIGAVGPSSNPIWFAAGCLLALTAAVIFGVRSQMASCARIDSGYVWVRGACPEYLAELPSWDGMR